MSAPHVDMNLIEIATTLGRIENQCQSTAESLKDVRDNIRELNSHVNDLRGRMQLLEPMVHDHNHEIDKIKADRAQLNGGISVIKFLWFIVPIVISWLGGWVYFTANYDVETKDMRESRQNEVIITPNA